MKLVLDGLTPKDSTKEGYLHNTSGLSGKTFMKDLPNWGALLTVKKD